jgi:Zn-finger nucleic acid-binding protein
MRLIACKSCHAQYDITDVTAEHIDCRCGEQVEVVDLESRDLAVHRCSGCGAHVAVGDRECDYCSAPIISDPRLLSLICPECCSRNSDDARFCGACGVVFDPQPVETPKSDVPCPVCTSLTTSRMVGNFSVSECPSCNGIWCPAQSFEALVKAALQSKKSGITYRKCPECDAFMQRRNFRKTSGVIIDRCHKHGTWLDADELEQIAGYLLSGGRPQAERFMREADLEAESSYRESRRGRIAAESGTTSMASMAMRRATDTRSSNATSSFGGGMLGLLSSLLD